MNKPVVVWQRGRYRIVAIDGEEPSLVFEISDRDAMGCESWMVVCPHASDDIVEAQTAMMFTIASQKEMLPRWVRELVREACETLFEEQSKQNGGAA